MNFVLNFNINNRFKQYLYQKYYKSMSKKHLLNKFIYLHLEDLHNTYTILKFINKIYQKYTKLT